MLQQYIYCRYYCTLDLTYTDKYTYSSSLLTATRGCNNSHKFKIWRDNPWKWYLQSFLLISKVLILWSCLVNNNTLLYSVQYRVLRLSLSEIIKAPAILLFCLSLFVIFFISSLPWQQCYSSWQILEENLLNCSGRIRDSTLQTELYDHK